MSSQPDTVGESIVILGCSSAAFVHAFVWTDLVTTMSHALLEESLWNFRGIFASPYWWSRFWRSRSQLAV